MERKSIVPCRDPRGSDAPATLLIFPSRHASEVAEAVQALDEIRQSLRHTAEQLRRNAEQLHQIDLTLLGLQGVDEPPPIESLTEREIQIMQFVARGHTNLQIAQQLVLAEGTVRNHLSHILAKLHATNRAEAAYKARALGII